MLRDEKSCYTGKRSFDLQKVKTFFDSEYKVIGLEEGTKKMLNSSGVMEEVRCVKSLVIEHKGTHMNVGSGLSDEERIL
jgi:ATP-dependent DNA ligase